MESVNYFREYFTKKYKHAINWKLKILQATYSYYPYNFGGTEVYVSGLAAFLQQQGHSVTVIAGMPATAFIEHPVFFEDDELAAITYSHEGIPVIGLVLKDETTTEIYKKFRVSWVASWQHVLSKAQEEPWDILHIHAHTSAIGEALVKAAKLHSPGLKVIASYHVPVSCVKGTLLFGNSMMACSVKPAIAICSACFISSKQNWALPFAKKVAALLPILQNDRLPTSLRLKFLAKEFLDSFASFNEDVDAWHVFSEQVKSLMLLNGVAENKIVLLRHGVNPYFFEDKMSGNFERLTAGPTIFLYTSRFDKLKGFITMIKAWCSLPKSNIRQLWMIGETQTMDQQIAEYIKSAMLRTDIKWLGPKDQIEVAEIMGQAHCTIIPSEWVEIGPLVFHEAIASGSNVIASDMGGCRELYQYYNNCSQLFKAGNADSLAEKILAFEYKSVSEKPLSSTQNYEQVLANYEMAYRLV